MVRHRFVENSDIMDIYATKSSRLMHKPMSLKSGMRQISPTIKSEDQNKIIRLSALWFNLYMIFSELKVLYFCVPDGQHKQEYYFGITPTVLSHV